MPKCNNVPMECHPWLPHISPAAHGNPLKGLILSTFVRGLKGYKKTAFMI